MQGDWDRRERSTGVSFRREEIKNGQRTGPCGGTGPGGSPTLPSHPIYAYVYGPRVGLQPFSLSCHFAMPSRL
jgi:hypothetical protein